MTEDKSTPPATDGAASGGDDTQRPTSASTDLKGLKPARRTQNLLPRQFQIEQARGRHTQVDPVEIARAERDNDARHQRRQRQAERNQRRHERKQTQRRLELLREVATWLVLTVVVLAPVAIGAVHMVALAPLTLLAALAAGAALWAAQLSGRPFRVGLAGWALIGLSLFTFLQAVPLPMGVLSGLSGQVAQWVQDAWGASLGDPPSTATLSLHPGESARMGFVWWTAAALYLAVYNLFREREKFQKLLLVLPAVGVLLVIIGVLQKAAGISDRLFFYQPRDLEAAPFFASTFVNPNHLGTLLGLISFVPLGMSLSKDYRYYRGALVLLFTICAAGMVMSLSITSLLAWVVGMIAFGLLILRRRLSDSKGLAYISLGAVLAVGLGAYAAWSQLAERASFLTQHQGLAAFTPTELWQRGWQLALGSPLFGVGSGGFADGFAAISAQTSPARLSYINNSYLQLFIDYGIPVATVVIALLAFTVGRLALRRGWKSNDLPLMTALLAGFVFLAFEASVSFSLEIPGVLLPATFALALADGRHARYRRLMRRRSEDGAQEEPAKDPEPQYDTSPPRQPLLARMAPALGLGVAALVALPTISTLIDATGGLPLDVLRQAATTEPVTVEAVNGAYREALRHRPANGEVHLNAAVGFLAAGDDTQGWEALERARRFNRGNPAPPLLAGRTYLRQGKREEALGAYKDALALAAPLPGDGALTIALELARRWEDPAKLASALPPDVRLQSALLEKLLAQGRAQETLGLAQTLQAGPQGSQRQIKIWEAWAMAHMNRWEQAQRIAQELLEPEPGPPGAYVVLIQALTRQGKMEQASQMAQRALRHHGFDTEVLFTTASLYYHHRDQLGFDRDEKAWAQVMDPLLQQLKPHVIKEPSLRPRYYKLAGLYHSDLGRLPTAISELQKSMEALPSDPEVVLALARLLRRDRQNQRAMEIYRLFTSRFPDDPNSAEAQVDLYELEQEQQTLQEFRQGQH